MSQITAIYHCFHGSLPYLTPIVKSTLPPFPYLSISLSDFLHLPYSLIHDPQFSLHSYLGHPPETRLYLSFFRWDQALETGTNSWEKVRIVTDKGCEEVGIKEVAEWQFAKEELWRWEQVGEGGKIGGIKREKRAIGKNFDFMKEQIDEKEKEKEGIVGIVCGGDSEELRVKAMEGMISLGVRNIVIQGVEQLSDEKRVKALECLESYPVVKIIKGGEPVIALQCILKGVSQIIVYYPWLLVEKGEAIDFQWKGIENKEESKENKSKVMEKLAGKKGKVRDLKRTECANEFGPICKECECYACKEHTVAYINHLIKCRELTGNVLIAVHNAYQYQKFIAEVNKAIESNYLNRFVNYFVENNCMQ